MTFTNDWHETATIEWLHRGLPRWPAWVLSRGRPTSGTCDNRGHDNWHSSLSTLWAGCLIQLAMLTLWLGPATSATGTYARASEYLPKLFNTPEMVHFVFWVLLLAFLLIISICHILIAVLLTSVEVPQHCQTYFSLLSQRFQMRMHLRLCTMTTCKDSRMSAEVI